MRAALEKLYDRVQVVHSKLYFHQREPERGELLRELRRLEEFIIELEACEHNERLDGVCLDCEKVMTD